jgi:hypothetical protein
VASPVITGALIALFLLDTIAVGLVLLLLAAILEHLKANGDSWLSKVLSRDIDDASPKG